MEFSKKNLLEQYLIKHRELGKRQREYKKLLNYKPPKNKRSRRHYVNVSSTINSSALLKLEKNELKAQLYASEAKIYEESDDRDCKVIKCHIACQEQLSDDIRQIKTEMTNMSGEISRITRNIYEINLKIVPDAMHQMHVARARKKMQILENQLEVGVRRECIITADNANLRDEVIDQMHCKRNFDDCYTKMVERLNSDRKYINELIEYLLNIHENCIDIFEKMEFRKKDTKKKEMMYVDMIHKYKHDESILLDQTNFHLLKNAQRNLADLQPKEYRRRERISKKLKSKLELFKKIFEKIVDFTKSNDGVAGIIKKFKEQESIYYSYFSYQNEMSYHMTLLNNSVNSLTDEINMQQYTNFERVQKQEELLEQLQTTLEQKRENNRKLLAQANFSAEKYDNLIKEVIEIFKMIYADGRPLKLTLGTELTKMSKFLKIMEQRVHDIVASVYVTERANRTGGVVVRDIGAICEPITPLDDIVLAQQCPECAEGEAVNDVEDGGAAFILEDAEFKKRLYEKVKLPEMQYRLHTLSQCRLPRSRVLTAKR